LFDRELGRGSFGTVFLAHDTMTGTEVAIKVFKKRVLKRKFIGKGKNGLTLVLGEIQILLTLDHPNIIKILEVIESASKIYLVLEYARKGPIS
jgi:serine/threonine protein kinase